MNNQEIPESDHLDEHSVRGSREIEKWLIKGRNRAGHLVGGKAVLDCA